MMLEILNNIIHPDSVLPITQTANGQGTLVLKENDEASKIKKLNILDVKQDSFAFTLDHKVKQTDKKHPCFKQLSSYFHPENNIGINKGCDLVLFTQFRKAWYVLLLDMKSDKPNKSATERQLQNSELFVKYICSLVTAYYPDAILQKLRYKKTYTITQVRKNPVYSRRDSAPSDYLSISVDVNAQQEASVHLGKLLGQ